MKASRPFTDLEREYIRRVAGRVPVAFMSSHLGRETRSVRDYCVAHKISTRVPGHLLKKYWPEYIPIRKGKESAA